MITATITNVTKDGNGIRVFYRFSDNEERSQLFPAEYTRPQIRQAIKTEVDQKNDVIQRVANFQDIIGEVLS